MTYAALHCHGEASPDGVGKTSQWVEEAKKKKLAGIGITDHGLFYSALELYEAGQEHEFPVVLGEEFYVIDDPAKDGYYHITVWCKNAKGYSNLCKLSTLAFSRPFFKGRPRITYDILCKLSEGLIVGSGCFIGEVNYKLLEGDVRGALDLIAKLKATFKDDFYLEIMPAQVKFDERMAERLGADKHQMGANLQLVENARILRTAKKLGIKYICSSDAHMPDASMATLQRVKMYNKSKNWEYDYLYYLHDYEGFKKQWTEEFGLSQEDFDVGCANTVEIVDKCKDLKLEFPLMIPKIEYHTFPSYKEKDTNKDLVYRLVAHHAKIDLNDKVYKDRLDYEINVLADNGIINLLDYFLLLEDVCRHCVSNNIMVGVGRGSAGGSLLSYALNITDIDPIVHSLSFERFINITRIQKGTFPDIDLDIESVRRPEVIRYIQSKYGADKVALFGTVHTMKLKLALRDIIRILDPNKPQDEIEKLVASIPWVESDQFDLELVQSAIEKSAPLMSYFKQHPETEKTLWQSLGQMRQYGVHAAAVAISPVKIFNFVPLAKKATGEDNFYYTQFPMEYCAKAGLIKYDILGLKTLSDIRLCLELIEKRHGKKINPWRDIPLDDALTLKNFQRGFTTTVFQFNTETFGDLLRNVREAESLNFNDLVAMNTLGRPGTFDTGMHKEWIDRRLGSSKVTYPHHSLQSVLDKTYGIILYQEQVMKALKILADYTDAEADDIRRAIGKKKTEIIDKFGSEFAERAMTKWPDITKDKAKKIWDLIEAFGRYSFNESHAAAYSIVAYVCQWLKTYYVLEWWCAILINETDDDKRRSYYKHIKSLIAPYDVNESKAEYYIDYKQSKIVPPISSIKFIGKVICQKLDAHRPFKSFDHFMQIVADNAVAFKKHIIINMIIGGLFNKIEPDRSELGLLEHYYKSYLGARITREKPNKAWREWELNYKSVTPIALKKMQMEILPYNAIDLNELLFVDEQQHYNSYEQLPGMGADDSVALVGLVIEVKHTKTKKGESMFFATLANQGSTASMTIFPKAAAKYRDIFRKGSLLRIRGSINEWNSKRSIVVDWAQELL